MVFTTDATIATFGGKLVKLTHESTTTNTPMNVNVYLPPSYSTSANLPVVLYLSGLTCTPNNASEKAFWQPYANKFGFAVVFPDTSPRGAGAPGEDDSWDFGTGAGFYVDATTNDFKKHYNMYSYVHGELQTELAKEFSGLDFSKVGITGHSMGGYGALSGYLQNPGKYSSVSAFAPICNPVECQWGKKNFGGYLGDDIESWKKYDPTELVKGYQGEKKEVLIHVGKADPFYFRDHQLLPENFEAAAKDKLDVTVNYEDGYDHSYYFIASFVEEHAKFHAKHLGLEAKL